MEQVDGYRLREVLHRSGRSTVLRGRRLDDDRPAVVKVLTARRCTSRDVARFRYTFEILRDLDLPGVPTALELIEHEGRPALVVEDIGGRDLDGIADERALALGEVLRIALAVAETLGQLHQRQLVHGDVKPSNIVLDEAGGRVQLIDFDQASRLELEIAQVRHTSSLECTFAFASPEQTGRTNRPVDHRSDLYCLGATLYRDRTLQLYVERCRHFIEQPPGPDVSIERRLEK